jgi:RNA polymerase sigma-70 factor (ECF subfamily)
MHITTEILQACADNDRRAQKQLYEYTYKMLISVCMRYHSNHEDARFAFNNGFLKIVTGLASIDLDTVNYHGWSKRIMINGLIDEYRRNKNHQSTIFAKETDGELEYHAENAVNNAESQMGYDSIMQLLTTIPPISAHVFTLYVIDGYNHKEIGTMLGITEGTSKWHLSTARKQLRDRLEQLEELKENRFAI